MTVGEVIDRYVPRVAVPLTEIDLRPGALNFVGPAVTLARLQREREDAARAEVELRGLRSMIDSPLMHGGTAGDPVSRTFTKAQWSLLLVLVEQALA